MDGDGETRRLLHFDHAGACYVVTATPSGQGLDLTLEKNGAQLRGFGFVDYAAIGAAVGSTVDPVDARMEQIRDAVLSGCVE